MLNRRKTVKMLAIFGIALSSTVAQAQDGGASFEGERIEWIVPFGEGGGTDTMARFLAPFFAKHLPGKPTIIVRNVPGGGSTLGANSFAASAKPDGLTVLQTGGSTVMPFLLGDQRVAYDYRDFIPVIATSSNAVVYTQADLGLEGPEDIAMLRGQELRFGSQGASSLDLLALWAFEMLDLDVKPVFGLDGSGAKRLAFERGESQIDMQTSASYLEHVQPRQESGDVIPLWAWGIVNDDGELERDPTYPDLPHFGEAYASLTGSPPEGSDFETLKTLITAGYGVEKFVFLPNNTPEGIVQAWRDAAAALADDPDFQAKKVDVMGEYPYLSGARVEKALSVATNLSDKTRQEIVSWLSEEFGYQP